MERSLINRVDDKKPNFFDLTAPYQHTDTGSAVMHFEGI